MKLISPDKRVSFICHLLLAIAILPLLFLYGKNESLMMVNRLNSPLADIVFYHITRLPELAMIVFVIILSIFYERRIFLATVIAMSLCGLSILFFKHILFPDFERPSMWLNSNHINFHRVEGIRLHTNGSFPSGHTIAAFCSLALVGFISRNGFLQFLLFILACASAYSRVYASQHYLMDVYAGALIGYFYAYLFFTLFENRFKTPVWQKPLIRFRK